MESETIGLLLNAVSTLCFFLCVFVINGFKNSMDKMQGSIGDLNINIAQLIEKDANKDQRIDDHRELIRKLEGEVSALRDKYHSVINKACTKVDLLELEFKTIKDKVNK